MKKPELSIVVLTYNGEKLLPDCLASIDVQDIPCTYEKVVVDNGSDTPVKVPTGWRVVRIVKNVGHIVGQNKCFEAANGEWVMFVANDVRLHPRCIRGLINSTCKTFPWHQIQPMLLKPDGSVDQTGMYWKWPGYGVSRKKRESGFVPIIPSTCYIMRKQLHASLGGFDENLKTSHEDVDIGLSYRQCVVRVNSVATHLGNATLRHQPSHNRDNFHSDRMYVIRKHYRGLDRTLRIAATWVIHAVLEIGSVLSYRYNKKV